MMSAPPGFEKNCVSESSRKRKLALEQHGTVVEDGERRKEKKSEGSCVGGGGKLWDGSLHLNSSVTVPAVAFFKSGEKMPDVKWCDSVEVKGKVRLDAFEKYIQDLPRSRNRGLMVISICCKEGSSESGLAGMKEVAKGYKQSKRVGLAQLSQGIDLYVCPRSDTIFTILAKHGFFKGMGVVEDNQDSLIGCVVWRRHHAPSNSIIKKSERQNGSSNLPLQSPSNSSAKKIHGKDLASDSSAQGANGKDLAHEKPALQSIQVASTAVSTSLGDASGSNLQCKNIKTGKIQPELHTSSTIVLSNLLTILKGPQISPISGSSPGVAGRSVQVEAPSLCFLQEKPISTPEAHRPVLPVPSHATKQPIPSLDDDLPEFDFGSACGISQTQTNKHLDVATAGKKLRAEEFTKINGLMPPKVPTLQSMRASNGGQLRDICVLKPPLDAVLRMLPIRKVCEDNNPPEPPNSGEKHASQGRMPVGTTSAPLPKNLFDDDDMPEWRPPSIEPYRQSVFAAKPSITSRPSKLPKSAFDEVSPGPSNHLFPSPFPAAYPPFSPKPLPHIFHGPMGQKLAQPGFNSNTLSRPPVRPFDAKVQVHPAGWRSWRP